MSTDGIMSGIPEELELQHESVTDVGIAVDVGTATVALNVWSLSGRKLLASISEKNTQMRYGYDVIRRIAFATRPPLTGSSQTVETGPSALHYAIISQLEQLYALAIQKISQDSDPSEKFHISRIVITGNTAMLSMVCAFPLEGLAAAPFEPASLFGFTASWSSVRLGTVSDKCTALDSPTPEFIQLFENSVVKPSTPVYFPPCIGGFVGADTVCAMISAGFPSPVAHTGSAKTWETPVKAPLLLADIGTNVEIALCLPGYGGNPPKLMCTSAAAGPAFEGANISCGISSVEGAVDHLDYNGDLVCRVIGGGKAKGLCGSGLISACSVLYGHKYIDKSGIIQKSVSKLGDGSICIQLTPAVFISQQDIRNIQLAKSAVYTGLSYMLEKSPSLPVLCLAGSAGCEINMEEACHIGLIPEKLEKRCVHLGNAALAGASALLFSKTLREKAIDMARHTVQINLAAVPDFQQRYLESIDF